MSSTIDRVRGGRPSRTPRQMRRASSRPETTSSAMPASRRARRTISSRFRASRTALVATARTRARYRRQSAAYRESVVMSRSATGRVSAPVAKTPSPGRTGSRSWCNVSSEPSGSGRAISSRTAFVPTSIAASTRSLTLAKAPPFQQARESSRRSGRLHRVEVSRRHVACFDRLSTLADRRVTTPFRRTAPCGRTRPRLGQRAPERSDGPPAPDEAERRRSPKPGHIDGLQLDGLDGRFLRPAQRCT